MSGFSFQKMGLEGAYIINNFSSGDIRGGFTKTFEKSVFKNAGIDFSLTETFVSVSAQNVIRGLHFQTAFPQKKIVTVLAGRAWDVIVDLRMDSPTYKKWEAVELSAENHRGVFVPEGFAHGFASLEDGTIMLYQCEGEYNQQTDTGIRYDDLQIGIKWPVEEERSIHSKRDLELPGLEEYEKHPMILNEKD